MKFEKYKFKDTKSLIAEIEDQLFNISLKLQSHSKNIALHHICVKTFLNKGKILLALKSMIFLHKNAANTFEYYDALFKFKEHISKSQNYIELIYEHLPLLKENVSNEYSKNIDYLTHIYESDYDSILKILDLDKKVLLNLSSQVFFYYSVYA
jgi:ADP-heptose:LPS heptosyltransferase